MRQAEFLVEFLALTPLPVAIYDLDSRIVGLKTNSPLPHLFCPILRGRGNISPQVRLLPISEMTTQERPAVEYCSLVVFRHFAKGRDP